MKEALSYWHYCSFSMDSELVMDWFGWKVRGCMFKNNGSLFLRSVLQRQTWHGPWQEYYQSMRVKQAIRHVPYVELPNQDARIYMYSDLKEKAPKSNKCRIFPKRGASSLRILAMCGASKHPSFTLGPSQRGLLSFACSCSLSACDKSDLEKSALVLRHRS